MTESRSVPGLEVQYAVDADDLPTLQEFEHWVEAALQQAGNTAELTIRVVDEAEGRQLNAQYRDIDRATNVLSFPFEAPPGIEPDYLGDLVICAPVVRREAQQQRKAEKHHWAHMVVHGVLHLRGYDHRFDTQAEEMETLEKQILAGMGIQDPYQTDVAV
ncbi:MAG TPA: rRNA maturation RNase YbeY [Gammaproteobacteria bacterium]|nr:rRNA maturation RNase YbeY [Gammaproteobacteria bacterium]